MTEAARTLALADNLLREAKVRRDHSEDYDDDITSWIEQAEKIVRAVARSPLPGTREEVARDVSAISDEDMRDLLSAKDVGTGRARLRRFLAALPPAPMPERASVDCCKGLAPPQECACQMLAGDREGKQLIMIEDGARAIAISEGHDPDDLAPVTTMCTVDNEPVKWWKVFEEQAEACLRAALPPMPEREALKTTIEDLKTYIAGLQPGDDLRACLEATVRDAKRALASHDDKGRAFKITSYPSELMGEGPDGDKEG